MGKRGPKKIYTEEERKYRRTESVKKSRKRYRRCEMEMFPSTLERLKDIKNKLGISKGLDRITWNDCMHHMASFIEMHNETFFNFARTNRTVEFTPAHDESPTGGYDNIFLLMPNESQSGGCDEVGSLSSSPGPGTSELTGEPLPVLVAPRVLPSLAEALKGM